MKKPVDAPGQIGGVTLRQHLDVLAVDDDALVIVGDLALEATRDRVVLQQVSEGLVVGEVVNGDDLDVRALLESSAEEVAADAAEAVDANAGGHYVPPARAPRGARYSMQPGVRVASPARRCLRFQQFLIYTPERALSQSNLKICTWGNSRLD